MRKNVLKMIVIKKVVIKMRAVVTRRKVMRV